MTDRADLKTALAPALYYISSRSRADPITDELIERHLARLSRRTRWAEEKGTLCTKLRQSLTDPEFPFEEIHGSRAYTRAELRRYVELILERLIAQ